MSLSILLLTSLCSSVAHYVGMPPKRYGTRGRSYRSGTRKYSGYTRSSYTKRRSSYGSRKAGGTWGGRKYTRAKPVYGMKNSVPTTTMPARTRVEVKQRNFLQPARLPTFTGIAVPRVTFGATEAAAQASLLVEMRKVLQPIMGLRGTVGNWNPIIWIPAAGENPNPPGAFANHTIEQNLCHLTEGVNAGQRIGRSINVTGFVINASCVNVSTTAFTPGNFQAGVNQVPFPCEMDWHIYVVLEKQPGVDGDGAPLHLTNEQFMNTFYDLTSCPNKMTAMSAQKNRYTADAHGRVLLHKKITVKHNTTQVARRYAVKFPKPLEIKYHGAGHAASENRLTMYILPIAPIEQHATTVQLANDSFYATTTFQPSCLNVGSTLYYTDA